MALTLTVTRRVDVVEPQRADRVYVVVDLGDTLREPGALTVPMP